MGLKLKIRELFAAKIQTVDAEVMEAAGVEAVETSGGAEFSGEKTVCRVDKTCDIAAAASEEEMYGGIQQEYAVKGCKVTIYNDGPVKMVNVKTDQPCNAPLPKDHKFSK